MDKKDKNTTNIAGAIIGNEMSKPMRDATEQAFSEMGAFENAARIFKNTDYDFAKGNLFEFIETGKFNIKAVEKGSTVRAFTTHSQGRPTDPTDIEIKKNNTVLERVQAKVSTSEKAEVELIRMQRDPKYKGMQRLIQKDENYKGTNQSLLERAKSLAEKRASVEGAIYSDDNRDVAEHLTDELHYQEIKSGGTTVEELREAYDNPQQYAQRIRDNQVFREMKASAQAMAQASFVTNGVVSGINNMMEVFQDKKELSTAVHDVGMDAVEGAIRGGATGVVSALIRNEGLKRGVKVLSDSTAATVMAGGMIDASISLYAYARGEIGAQELRDDLVDTVAKATTTVYFTEAIKHIGMSTSLNPIFPVVVYTTMNYVVACTREILNDAKLKTEEFDRLRTIAEESTKSINEYHAVFEERVAICEEKQKKMLENFLNSFEYDIYDSKNYNSAVSTIVSFANQAGIALQHVDFDDFKNAMTNHQTFKLG